MQIYRGNSTAKLKRDKDLKKDPALDSFRRTSKNHGIASW